MLKLVVAEVRPAKTIKNYIEGKENKKYFRQLVGIVEKKL